MSTKYELNNATSLHLKGLTTFYVKIDCGAGITASVKAIQIDAGLVTIDAEHPIIDTGTVASTFRLDQAATSGIYCVCSIKYKDRSWAG